MKCRQANKLFGAYWDDETTQAEREWLEAHFNACASCRTEYETYARSIEMVSTMPRVEAAPDLAERALTRARRASTAPDRLPGERLQWAPIAAAAAVLIVIGSMISPWLGPGGRLLDARRGGQVAQEAARTERAVARSERVTAAPVQPTMVEGAVQPLASAMPDSIFDHSENVEFVLDPVTEHRGGLVINRPQYQVQGEHAVISF